MKRLSLIAISLEEANGFVERHHRHRNPVVGHLWSTGAALDAALVGVSIVGRPISRVLDDGHTVEITRLATLPDFAEHRVPGFLIGAATRAAFARGFRKVVTYTLPSESGDSLRGAGYRVIAKVEGRSWDCPSRPRTDQYDLEDKLRWERVSA